MEVKFTEESVELAPQMLAISVAQDTAATTSVEATSIEDESEGLAMPIGESQDNLNSVSEALVVGETEVGGGCIETVISTALSGIGKTFLLC